MKTLRRELVQREEVCLWERAGNMEVSKCHVLHMQVNNYAEKDNSNGNVCEDYFAFCHDM